MAKHKIGDIVRYTNKNENINVIGEIIATWRDSWTNTVSVLIEPLDENYRHIHTHRYTVSSMDVNYQFNPNKFEAHGVSLQRPRRLCHWVPMKSKNLLPAYPPKDYDPSQNGDTDEDI